MLNYLSSSSYVYVEALWEFLSCVAKSNRDPDYLAYLVFLAYLTLQCQNTDLIPVLSAFLSLQCHSVHRRVQTSIVL